MPHPESIRNALCGSQKKAAKKGKKGAEGEVAAAATETAVRGGKAAAVGFKLALLCVCLGVCA